MKHLPRILFLTPILLFAALLCYLPLSSQSRFDKFCDRFFQEEITSNSLTLHYTLEDPERYGIFPDKVTLGSYELNESERKSRLSKNLFQLQTISKNALNENSQFTYDLLQYTLQTEREGLDYLLLKEPLVPSVGIQSQLPILLAEYAFYEEEDVTDYLQLLSCIPSYFDSLLLFEETKCEQELFMDQESAEELITYCQQFLSDKDTHFLAETFRERLDALELSSEQIQTYETEHRNLLETCVFPAYEKLELFLTEHRHEGKNEFGLYYVPDGTDYYQWLIRSEIGCNRTFSEIETLLEQALKQEASVIASLVKDQPELLEQRKAISLDTSNPAGLTSYLAQRSTRDFPEIPDVSVEICSVPASMEPHLSPAFYLVPAIDRYDQNVVYLNNGYLKEGISFFTTLAHESYPGHLYQNVFENSRQLHPIHRLLYFGGYSEGWATYAEQLSYFYAPISKDLAQLLASTRAMTLNLYSHLDLYIHAYGWTEEQCSDYLKKFGITASSSIHDMYLLVKQQPANYLKYYLGYLEFCHLRTRAEELQGEDFDLKNFHTLILTYGPAPFPILNKYVVKKQS